jgi:hypothetical protein
MEKFENIDILWTRRIGKQAYEQRARIVPSVHLQPSPG